MNEMYIVESKYALLIYSNLHFARGPQICGGEPGSDHMIKE
jgi:hypothetical protein